MTDLQIRVDSVGALNLFASISDNFPRARTNALNKVAVEVNGHLQYDAVRKLVFRGNTARQMLNDYAPIPLFRAQMARDDRPYATPVDPQNAGKILRPFETGGFKTTNRFGAVPAIPTRMLRPGGREVIPRKLYPSALFPEMGTNFTIPKTPSKWNKGKGRSGKGFKAAKPFILNPNTMQGLSPKAWGIYKRVGPGRMDIKRLWSFRLVVPKPKLLDTYGIARRVTAERWPIVMAGAFRSIVQGGRGKASLLDLTV